MFCSKKQSYKALLEAYLGALCEMSYESLLGEPDDLQAWPKFYALHAVLTNFNLDFLAREAIIDMAKKIFVNSPLTEEEKSLFKALYKRFKSDFSVELVVVLLHASQYRYTLEKRGLWKESYENIILPI
jgi:hypothetical protein